MAKREPLECPPVKVLRALAMQYPEAEEGTSCNKLSFKARKKAFLYVGADAESYNVMLKLTDSIAEAEKLGAKSDAYSPGNNGWTRIIMPLDDAPPAGLLERWIDESYRALAHKELVAMLPDLGTSTKSQAVKKSTPSRKPVKKKLTKKKSAKKKTTAAKAKKSARR